MDRKSDKSVNLLNSLTMGSTARIPSNAMVANHKINVQNVQNQSLYSRHNSGLSGQPSSQSSSHSSNSSHSSQMVYTPRLKKVLKSYQASATTSLNGPDWPHRVSSMPTSPSTSSSSSVSSPLSSVPPNIVTPQMPLNSYSGSESKGVTKTSNPLLSKTSLLSEPLSRSTIDSNRLSEMSSRSSLSLNRSKTIGSKDKNKDCFKGESYDPFLAPPPFPIQQPPIFTPPDQNRCERSETILEGETISCFTVGGEKRLCLPQILTTVLRDFSLPQINSVCDELQIFCSRCTTDQLDVLKMTAIIPASAPSCGLITKTDAERLCAALLYSNPPKAAISAMNGKQVFTLRVYHQCFGKCIGLYVPALYVQPFSTCIECLECHGLFAPQKFVCHSHHSRENRTCHWGFDSSNWRAYLLLKKDRDKNRINAKTEGVETDVEEQLNEMKARFDFKRKIADPREENPICDPSKRLKCEDSSPSGGYPYPSYLFSPYGWADPSMLMYWYPALASGLSGGSGSLSARLSAFKPWSANALANGKHLPPNLLQCMPHGFDRCLPSNKCRDSPQMDKTDKIGNKILNRCSVESSVCSVPLKTFDSQMSFMTQKQLKSSVSERRPKDKNLFDDNDNDSFSSNPTLGSENSNFSDEENSLMKNKSEKVFTNLELILEENNLSTDLKTKIISEVQNIINKLSSVESTRPTPPTPPTLLTIHTTHKKKILNEIQDKKSKQSLETTSTDGNKFEDIKSSVTSSLGQGVSSCSPPLIKQEPNSSPLMADPKLNCVH